MLGDDFDPASEAARQLAYWRAQLANLPEQITLPTDRPRPPVVSYRGGQLPLHIASTLHAQLLTLARTFGVTLFMVLYAALAILLKRLGAGDDIAIGTIIAGRTDASLDSLIGFFVNTLVLRTDLSGTPSIRGVLDRVRDHALAAYAHQDIPFERVVEILNPVRVQSRHPLFQIMLSIQDEAPATLTLPSIIATPLPVGADVATFDLTLHLAKQPGPGDQPCGLIGEIAYNSDLFDSDTIAQFASRLIRVLEAMACHPAQSIAEIDIFAPTERHRLLTTWNDNAEPLPDYLVPDWFESQAAQTPTPQLSSSKTKLLPTRISTLAPTSSRIF